MANRVFLVFALLVCLHFVSSSTQLEECAECPSGWSCLAQHCYMLATNRTTWMSANSDCVARGGHLTSVTNSLENELLAKLFAKSTALGSVYIGLKRGLISRSFHWSDGLPVTFTRWKLGTATNVAAASKQHDCVAVHSGNGMWHQVACSAELAFVCKKRAAPRDGQARLVDGVVPSEGKVELFVGGKWHSVCQTGWNGDNANVLCRQLAYERVVSPNSSTTFHLRGQDFVIDMACDGDEDSLGACAYTSGKCSGGDVEVVCFNGRVTSRKSDRKVAADRCPAGWVKYASSCFKQHDELLSFGDAERKCNEVNGGHLASVGSFLEQGFIWSTTRGDTNVWLGLSDESRGDYNWTDGSNVLYANWADVEPLRTANKRCVVLDVFTGKWQKEDCSASKAFVCKQSLLDVDNPSTEDRVDTRCDTQWTYYNGNCYFIQYKFDLAAQLASSLCTGGVHDGHLTSVISSREHGFVSTLLSPVDSYWIGLQDSGAQGQFGWSDNSSVTFTQWDAYEPQVNRSDGNCVLMLYKAGRFVWQAARCDMIVKAICKAPAMGEPTSPPTLPSLGDDRVEMCPPRWIQYEKRCYLDATERRTWIDAESECTRDGGHLISFHSATDHQSVVKNRDVWVGLNDLEVEGRYRWSDGSPLNYVNFYQRHTNGVDSQQTDCFVSRNGAWELRKCDERHQFICWQPVILDVDECNSELDECDDNARCENTIGSYTCRCSRIGYAGDGFTCSDVNECNNDAHDCHKFAQCVNTIGSYGCVCQPGWRGNGNDCTDIDECREGSHGCSEFADCVNTDGSFTCKCKKGYVGNGKTCNDIDECNGIVFPCNPNAWCANDPGSYTCRCRKGWSGDGIECMNVNECRLGSTRCNTNAVCVDVHGSYECRCKDGYQGDGFQCTDINECNIGSHSCHDRATCVNQEGSYTCRCNVGWSGNGSVCVDVDECATDGHNCHAQASCTNTRGSFQCTCNQPGWEGDGRRCKDVNECATERHDCHAQASCTNTRGSFQCTCNQPGWEGDGRRCKDVNECATERHDCHAQASCTNTRGSFQCTCNQPGWEGDGRRCKDVNECATERHDCHAQASCSNTDGSFQCACNQPGWEGDGRVCEDVDECATGNNDCNENAVCRNSPGRFVCECNEGYVGDGVTCTKDSCPPFTILADGVIIGGSFLFGDTVTFKCNSGFRLSGSGKRRCQAMGTWSGQQARCIDVNECAEKVSDCDVNNHGTCTNTDGSYSCGCERGYQLLNKRCSPISCGRPLLSQHVTMDFVDFVFESVVTFGCDSGYGRSGSSSATCQANGRWNSKSPVCLDIDECAKGSHSCHRHAKCVNSDGSFDCKCNDGWKGNGRNCKDINECTTGSYTCHDNAHCVNTNGSYTCHCLPGFSGNGRSCVNINECEGDHGCHKDAKCDNTMGSYRCKCRRGASGDGWNCEDIDECATLNHDCDVNADCKNTHRSYKCRCRDGWFGDGKTCNDTNECDQGNHSCDAHATCRNTEGSYRCVCHKGWQLVGNSCIDINECQLGIHACSKQAQCVNARGSYRCVCNVGWHGDGKTCIDVDECGEVNECDVHATCVNSVGSYDCRCDAGWRGDGFTCKDKNECSSGSHECHQHADCNNNEGSYRCMCKSPGWSGDGFNCSDIDECRSGKHECHTQAECRNTHGSYQCGCKGGGWRGDGYECIDINECQEGTDECDENADCVNAPGSYECVCRRPGWRGDGRRCVDVDECVAGSDNCHVKAKCRNTDGSFKCTCRRGYSGNGKSCSDVDECQSGQHNCDPNADCVNSDGSFSCRCRHGWSRSGSTCADINECLSGQHECDVHAQCVNTAGSYTCKCNESGWHGNGKTCIDVNECRRSLDRCHSEARCINTEGSYRCKCKSPGWVGDGFNCFDFNECKEQTDECHVHAVCTNTNGSYTCDCERGYSGNGKECVDINECTVGHECHGRARCVNTDGDYECVCLPGWSGNGFECGDDDECGSESDRCHLHARCINSLGNYSCVCEAGWTGDGFDCIDVDECQTGDHKCHKHAKCKNKSGSHTCRCNAGYTGDGMTCERLACGTVKNPVNGRREGSSYKFGDTLKFVCNRGFKLVGSSALECQADGTWNDSVAVCGDINECETGDHNCHRDATCENTVGMHTCRCNAGYTGDGATCERRACPAVKNLSNGRRQGSSYKFGDTVKFVCNRGFRLIGSPSLECQADGTWNDSVPVCEDIEECGEKRHNCSRHATCMNTNGAFSCQCITGYHGNGHSCEIMRCRHLQTIKAGHMLSSSRTYGAVVRFSCQNGYKLQGNQNVSCLANGRWDHSEPTCIDVDECDENLSHCDTTNGMCRNSAGSYSCVCNLGFDLDKETSICKRKRCPTLTRLRHGSLHGQQSMFGDNVSFTCDVGFELHGSPSLTCNANANWSGKKPACKRISCGAPGRGSLPVHLIATGRKYKFDSVVLFSCQNGYELEGAGKIRCTATGVWSHPLPSCQDVDECETNVHDCSANAICVNLDGSHSCSCKRGFTGNGSVCHDVDECEMETHVCDTNANCTNTMGSYECHCRHGWSGSGLECSDIDECSTSHMCHTNADCTNSDGSYTCRCSDGYEGNGFQCSDIDECRSSHECLSPAVCHNTDGNYTCTCPRGLIRYARECLASCYGNITSDTRGNITWPITTARDTARVDCPFGSVGQGGDRATRLCQETATGEAAWSDPDMSACRFRSLRTNLLRDIAAGGITDDNVFSVSGQLSETLQANSDQLTSDDIQFTTQVLDKIVSIGATADVERTGEQLLSITSSIMNASALAIADSQKSGNASSKVLGAMDMFVKVGLNEERRELTQKSRSVGLKAHVDLSYQLGHERLAKGVETALSVISYVGCALSIIGLTLTLAALLYFKKLRSSLLHQIHIQLCSSLLLMLVVFLVGTEHHGWKTHGVCAMFGALLHYCILAAFAWMGIEAFYMYKSLVQVFGASSTRTFLLRSCALAWGVPLIPIIIVAAVDSHNYTSNSFCWLSNVPAFFASFFVPIMGILVWNVIVFVWVLRIIVMQSRAKSIRYDKGKQKSKRKEFQACLAVMVLLGLTWLFGAFMIRDGRLVFSFLFAICNSLQGFFVFLFHCALNKEVQKAFTFQFWPRMYRKHFVSTAYSSSFNSRSTVRRTPVRQGTVMIDLDENKKKYALNKQDTISEDLDDVNSKDCEANSITEDGLGQTEKTEEAPVEQDTQQQMPDVLSIPDIVVDTTETNKTINTEPATNEHHNNNNNNNIDIDDSPNMAIESPNENNFINERNDVEMSDGDEAYSESPLSEFGQTLHDELQEPARCRSVTPSNLTVGSPAVPDYLTEDS